MRRVLPLLCALAAACGGGGEDPQVFVDAGVSDAPPVSGGPLRVDVTGETVRAVLPLPAGALLFREPTGGGLVEADVRRTLTWIDAAGATVAERRAAAGELFVDVAAHPSGEATLLVAEDDGARCALWRFGPTGARLFTTPLDETDLATDPTQTPWDPTVPWRVGACQPTGIRENARVAADGEAVYTLNRGGSSGTVLFRHARGAGGLERTLRQPLFPRHPASSPIGILASHRVLRSWHWSYVPRLVVDDDGRARALFIFGGGASPEIWALHSGEEVPELAVGMILTVERDGDVVGRRVIPRELLGAQRVTEVEGIRWLRGGVALVGRNAPAPLPESGEGWDGFLVHYIDGEAAPRLAARVDLAAATVLSDVAPLGETGWLVAGRAAYWQNPHGASISEPAASALVTLDAAGAVVREIALPQGPRHNGALSIAPEGGDRFLVGGLANGPGSHSADGDPAKLAADGWVQRAQVAP
jgi:hypothetical protein